MWSHGRARHTSGEASLPMPASDGAQTAQPQGLDGFGMVPLGQSMTPHWMGGHEVPPAPPDPPAAFPPVFAPPFPPAPPEAPGPPAVPPAPVAPPDEAAPACPPTAESPTPCDLSVLSLQPMPTRPTRTSKPTAGITEPTLPGRDCRTFFMSHRAVCAASLVPNDVRVQALLFTGLAALASPRTIRNLAWPRRRWANCAACARMWFAATRPSGTARARPPACRTWRRTSTASAVPVSPSHGFRP